MSKYVKSILLGVVFVFVGFNVQGQNTEKKALDHKPVLLAMVSCTAFIITTLLFISHKEIEAIITGSIACFSFIAAWRKL